MGMPKCFFALDDALLGTNRRNRRCGPQCNKGWGVMFASSRELVMLFMAGAIAACLMGFGILLAADQLLRAGQPASISAVIPQR
jgi:hypothetical protein